MNRYGARQSDCPPVPMHTLLTGWKLRSPLEPRGLPYEFFAYNKDTVSLWCRLQGQGMRTLRRFLVAIRVPQPAPKITPISRRAKPLRIISAICIVQRFAYLGIHLMLSAKLNLCSQCSALWVPLLIPDADIWTHTLWVVSSALSAFLPKASESFIYF